MTNTNGQDLYLKLVDPSGKAVTIINHHRVWNQQLFIASQREQFTKSGAKDQSDFRTVELSSEQEYRASRGYRPTSGS